MEVLNRIIKFRTVHMENKPHRRAEYMIISTESLRKDAMLIKCYILEGIIGMVF